MSRSAQLFQHATLKMLKAERCRTVADVLDRRAVALAERHRPAVALHHEGIWRGRAATASRTRLHDVIGAALYSLSSELATIARALRSEAAELEQEAAALRRRARALAAAEARAVRRAHAAQTDRAAAVGVRLPASAGAR